MVYQYALNISEELQQENLKQLQKIISEERNKKAERYVFDKDKIRCVTGEALLRYVIWKHYGLMGKELVFTTSKFGKPFLANHDNIQFNLSHAGDWVLCAAGNVTLGIDVERINEKMELEIAERFFTAEEYRMLMEQPSAKRNESFFQLWTLKESYIKAVGEGLQISLKRFRFEFALDGIKLFDEEIRDNSYTFLSNRLDDKHYMALCAKCCAEDDLQKDITMITLSDLLKFSDLMTAG